MEQYILFVFKVKMMKKNKVFYKILYFLFLINFLINKRTFSFNDQDINGTLDITGISIKKESEKKLSGENIIIMDNSGFFPCRVKDLTEIPLFSHMPCSSDVKQGYVGNCALMAALASVAEKDPLKILNSMKDNKNGTVTVRIYKKKKDKKTGKFTLVPRYYNIKKRITVLENEDIPYYSRGALWVSIWEIAYAKSGKIFEDKFENLKDVTLRKPKMRSVKDLEAVMGTSALEAITGKETKVIDFKNAISENFKDFERFYFSVNKSKRFKIKKELEKYNLKKEYILDNLNYISTELLNNKEENLMTLYKKLIVNKTEEEILNLKSIFKVLTRNFSVEDNLGKLLPEFGGNGPKGSGIYNKYTEDFYQKIKENENFPMIAGVDSSRAFIRNYFAFTNDKESAVKGLIFGHAYSVLGVKEENHVKYIKLRNPWGFYIRKYNILNTKLKSEEDDSKETDGVFYLELSQACRYISSIFIGKF